MVKNSSSAPARKSPQYRAPALEKGLEILELLSSESSSLTLAAICQRLGRSQGEIFRMVQVLQTRGFIDQDERNEGYVLTDRLFAMAMQQPQTQGMIELALPLMRSLATEVGQSCHLAFHSRGDIIVVARMESMEQIGFSVRVGYRQALIRTVSGLILFAFQPDDIRKRWVAQLDPTTSPAELETFVARAAEAKQRGFAKSASSFVTGVTDLSAPIMRGDRAAAALTIPYIKTTSSRGTTSEVLASLWRTAALISDKLVASDNRA